MQNIALHLPPEEWRPVPEFEGHYDVSSHGRIRSLKWGKQVIRKVSRHNRDGHRFVMLSKGSKRYQLVVARLVLLAFVGPPPTEVYVACHDKNGNEHDYLWRIRWDTVQENCRDRVRHGTQHIARGSDSRFAVLDEAKVRKMKRRLVQGASQNKVAKEFGVTQGTVSRIANGKSWAHVTI